MTFECIFELEYCRENRTDGISGPQDRIKTVMGCESHISNDFASIPSATQPLPNDKALMDASHANG